MVEMISFSFIVPVYNTVLYLRQCLDSMLNQDIDDFEICIVDDGSTDGSGDICDEYALRYENVHVEHQQNMGVSVARNKALSFAKGRYVWFVDSDDFIDGNVLKILCEIIGKTHCDTVFFGNQRIHDEKKVEFKIENKECLLKKHNCYCNPFMIFSLSVIKKNQLLFTEGMKMAEDLEFQYKYLLHSKRLVLLSHNFYNIRQTHNSASRNESSAKNEYEGCVLILEHMLEYSLNIQNEDLAWLGNKMVERLKKMCSDVFDYKVVPYSEGQKKIREIIIRYSKARIRGFNGMAVCLAFLDVRLFSILSKIKNKI